MSLAYMLWNMIEKKSTTSFWCKSSLQDPSSQPLGWWSMLCLNKSALEAEKNSTEK